MWNNYDWYHPTVKAEYDKKHDCWMLLRGPQTFYDENRRLRVFNTKEEALEWAKNNCPEYKIIE